MDSPLSILIVIFAVSTHLRDKASRNLHPLWASTKNHINSGLYHWDFHPQAKNPSPLSSSSSVESRANQRPLWARGEAVAPAWGLLVTGDTLEPLQTDPKWRTKPTAAASLRGATRTDEDHWISSPWAAILFSLKDPIEPCAIALTGEPAGVHMASLPSLLGHAYRFTGFYVLVVRLDIDARD
jgi:hypothetical protein